MHKNAHGKILKCRTKVLCLEEVVKLVDVSIAAVDGKAHYFTDFLKIWLKFVLCLDGHQTNVTTWRIAASM